ncbi:GNAT family N-acetyltransferase [Paenibacillus sp. KN14-4R]|uniref:GNAT family N-acetyltransferase n=1 Tax=Paenibacillus sp. KN14-4R TaxID=3445773 RepID=UPI003F9F5CA2
MSELQVRLKPWVESNLTLLQQLNIPEMLEHLGGTETEEQVIKRNMRYSEIGQTGKGRMFSIEIWPDLIQVGNIGYWEGQWENETVYEMGWGVLPAFQGKGIASQAALAAIAQAKIESKQKYLHAFPSVHNPSSNAMCRKLNFEFVSECDFEYPKDNWMKCNNWRLDLTL